jgi:hypothetical protein
VTIAADLSHVDELLRIAYTIRELGAPLVDTTDRGVNAIEYALNNWAVFPLNGKVPAIAGGRGVLDATTNITTIASWWGGRYAGCNIGGRVPESMFVIDIDPRHGGLESVAALEKDHGRLPETLTTISGRGDRGRHLFYRRPAGKLSDKHLGRGIDIKTSAGYVVLAPSVHPDSGWRYKRIDRPVAAPPAWLVELLLPERHVTVQPTQRRTFSGPSIADQFSNSTSWSEILTPHGWRCLDADPDGDGARWLHPTHTSSCSATVKHGSLFVYSTNTAFEVTESSNPRGYTRFRAYAVLNHAGDMSAAARSLRESPR